MSSDEYCGRRECSHSWRRHPDTASNICLMPGCDCTAFVQRPEHRNGPLYIAGPMTGLPGFNLPAFNAAAKMLRADGWAVENPADNSGDTKQPWEWYLREAIKQLVTCNAILMLPGWEASRGAVLEHRIANDLGMVVYLLLGDGTMVRP